MSIVERRVRVAIAMLAVVAVSLGVGLFANTSTAEAKAHVGTYEYVKGDLEHWGIGQGARSGYVLGCDVSRVSGNYATLSIYQTRFWGIGSYYRADMYPAKTVRVKNNAASFTFHTYLGDKCKAKLKIVSRNKVKLAVDLVKKGDETMPITTGYKYKLLKRVNR